MAEFAASDGTVFYVDEADVERVETIIWNPHSGGYVHGSAPGGKGRKVLLHRFILDAKPGQRIDHIDHDPRNNCRANLRFISHSANIHRSPKIHASSGIKGVTKRSETQWIAQIGFQGGTRYLGSFRTAELAAQARKAAAIELFGE